MNLIYMKFDYTIYKKENKLTSTIHECHLSFNFIGVFFCQFRYILWILNTEEASIVAAR